MKLISLITALLFMALKSQLYACSCSKNKKLDIGQLNNYQLVVKGNVLSISENKDDWLKEVKIEVLKIYKGKNIKDTITIKTGLDDASCGLNFKKRQKWIIYGFKSTKTHYLTGLCTKSQKINPIANLLLIRDRLFLKKYQEYTGSVKTKIADGQLKDGLPIGTWNYYKDNTFSETKKYGKPGILDGVSKVFYENGEVQYETIYVNGKWIKETYYDKEGNVDRVYEN